jgi:predicted phosphodiesterase
MLAAMRWLCVSDIHGDASALAAVLATAERRGYSRILAAGDLCFPGDAPLETWRRLTQANATCVQGVSDRAIAMLDPQKLEARDEHERARLERLRQARAELGDIILAKLAKLPPMVRIPLPMTTGPLAGGEMLLVHGSPVDPTEPFTHEMEDHDLLALVGDDPADVIVCGGSHLPFVRDVGGVRIINVGSVGEALGSASTGRHADATFLDFGGGTFTVEQFVVPLRSAA